MKIFTSISFLALTTGLFSQSMKIDSLQQRLNQAKGTDRISIKRPCLWIRGCQ